MTRPFSDRSPASTAPSTLDASHAELAGALRALAVDAVETAQSGHPGLPLGMADVATVLFSHFLKFDPSAPDWPDRDRFVLSAGHGSMLLYALLHLTGYPDMSLDEIRRFRQIGSRCAGHPEYGLAPGIETTTGPLGQGLANAIGMALAERLMAARFGADLVDHRTYVIVSDGDLMEGVAQEAISLAGHLRLHKLVVLYDDNKISIDGATDLSLSENMAARFEAAGWQVAAVDGHASDQVRHALEWAQSADRPTMIACRTIIGYGAPTKAGTAASHGAPLGAEEIAGLRRELGWVDASFVVSDRIAAAWRRIGARGAAARQAWEARRAGLAPEQAAEFDRLLAGDLPPRFGEAIASLRRDLAAERPSMATRKASQRVLDSLTAAVPEMIGGSADLSESNGVRARNMDAVAAGNFAGRYIHYGVREHAMAAIMNGMALHKGVIPFGGTFLVFSDYCRPAIRLAALMEQRVVFVMTHDSIGLGEDGPTHQPVEHLAGLRAIPNLLVLRPADAMETAECWQIALESRERPSLLVLTRQNLPALPREADENLCARGAYEVAAAAGEARVSLLATGSEVEIALAARDILSREGIAARVVSMPCWELFEEQSEEYRRAILRPDTVRVAVEAASPMGWDRYIGPDGAFIGMRGFGASGPYKELYAHFGITPEAVAEAARRRLG